MSNKFQQKGEISAAFGMMVLRSVSSSECQNMNLCPRIPLFSTLEPLRHLVVRTKGSWVTSQMRRSQGTASIEIVFLIRMMVWPLVAFLVWLLCCRKHKPNLPLPPPLSWKQNRTKSNRQSYPKKKGGREEGGAGNLWHSSFWIPY